MRQFFACLHILLVESEASLFDHDQTAMHFKERVGQMLLCNGVGLGLVKHIVMPLHIAAEGQV